MTQAAPLIIGADEREALAKLRALACVRPYSVVKLMDDLKTAKGEREHRARMLAQTIEIPGPWPFQVTFSIETGHPCGVCRHLSVSIERKGRIPSPEAMWMIAEELGFWGGLGACTYWPEAISGPGAIAINVVQPITVAAIGRA